MRTLLIFIREKTQVIRFIISGGMAAGANLAVLYLLTEYFGVHYLRSETIGFMVGFFVTFFLQKFWTFQDKDIQKLSRQMFLSFALAGANFFLNLFLLYTLTDIFHWWYFSSETAVIVLLAISNYFIYKNIIFR
jgi:putative flippase GtrA